MYLEHSAGTICCSSCCCCSCSCCCRCSCCSCGFSSPTNTWGLNPKTDQILRTYATISRHIQQKGEQRSPTFIQTAALPFRDRHRVKQVVFPSYRRSTLMIMAMYTLELWQRIRYNYTKKTSPNRRCQLCIFANNNNKKRGWG